MSANPLLEPPATHGCSPSPTSAPRTTGPRWSRPSPTEAGKVLWAQMRAETERVLR